MPDCLYVSGRVARHHFLILRAGRPYCAPYPCNPHILTLSRKHPAVGWVTEDRSIPSEVSTSFMIGRHNRRVRGRTRPTSAGQRRPTPLGTSIHHLTYEPALLMCAVAERFLFGLSAPTERKGSFFNNDGAIRHEYLCPSTFYFGRCIFVNLDSYVSKFHVVLSVSYNSLMISIVNCQRRNIQ